MFPLEVRGYTTLPMHGFTEALSPKVVQLTIRSPWNVLVGQREWGGMAPEFDSDDHVQSVLLPVPGGAIHLGP